jgi:hypothetical protein
MKVLIEKIMDPEILKNLQVLKVHEYDKVAFGLPSVVSVSV